MTSMTLFISRERILSFIQWPKKANFVDNFEKSNIAVKLKILNLDIFIHLE